MIALFKASEDGRRDLATSVPTAALPPKTAPAEAPEDSDAEEDFDEDADNSDNERR
jgi:hypothetical protein